MPITDSVFARTRRGIATAGAEERVNRHAERLVAQQEDQQQDDPDAPKPQEPPVEVTPKRRGRPPRKLAEPSVSDVPKRRGRPPRDPNAPPKKRALPTRPEDVLAQAEAVREERDNARAALERKFEARLKSLQQRYIELTSKAFA